MTRWRERVRDVPSRVRQVAGRAREGLATVASARGARRDLGRGAAFEGMVWPGGEEAPFPGAVIVDGAGIVRRIGPTQQIPIPPDLPRYGGEGCWVGPGIVDAHVHLAFCDTPPDLRSGLLAIRDLGAPAALVRALRTGHRTPSGDRPFIGMAGQILTAPGGYPWTSWGTDGFALPIADPSRGRVMVNRLATGGCDVIKLALEPGDAHWPVPDAATARAVAAAAHSAGLAVTAHALRADMVARAVDAGVDELAHTPTQRLPAELVERIADRGIAVVSTLQTFFSQGLGVSVAANAVALREAGVTLRYGTDLGNTGTRIGMPAGVDPRELDRLADTGLGRLGALRAATIAAAAAPGVRGRTGRLRVGEPAELVLLPGDPLREPGVWRTVSATVADGRLVLPADDAL